MKVPRRKRKRRRRRRRGRRKEGAGGVQEKQEPHTKDVGKNTVGNGYASVDLYRPRSRKYVNLHTNYQVPHFTSMFSRGRIEI